MPFRENLKIWVSEIFEKHNYSHEEKAFTHFFIKNFRDDHNLSETDTRSHVVDNPYDLGVDASYVTGNQDAVVFIQSKYSYNDSMLDPEIEKADSFLTNYFEINGGERSKLLSACNKELRFILENEIFPVQPETIYFIYLCGQFSHEISSKINNLQEKYKDKNVVFEQVNIDKLESLYDPYHLRNTCTMDIIPNHFFQTQTTTVVLDNDQFLKVKSCVFAATAASLQMLYNEYHDTLFEANVRNFLSFRKPINKGIRMEVEKASKSNLWFYNNGIVAVCDGFEVKGSKITAKNLQIVNGGQTVRSISAVRFIPDSLSVNCKLISIEDAHLLPANTKREFINNLAINSNKQNPISSRDLRSNDEIQRLLQKLFKAYGLFYHIKAGEEKIDEWKKQMKKEGKSVLNWVMTNAFISLFLQKPHASSGRTALAFLSENEGDNIINYENIFGAGRSEIQVVFRRLFLSWLIHDQVEKWRSLPEMREAYPFLYYAQNILLSLYGYWFYLSFNQPERTRPYNDALVRDNLRANSMGVCQTLLNMTSKACQLEKAERLHEFFDFASEKIYDLLSDKQIVSQPGAISSYFRKEITLSEVAERLRPKLITKKLFLV